MSLVKCPRCELNYMQDTDKVCMVCRGEMRNGEPSREEIIDLCVECGEHPVAPGEELCYLCIKEIKKQENLMMSVSIEADAGTPIDAVIDDIEIEDMSEKLPERGFQDDDDDDEELDEELGSEEEAIGIEVLQDEIEVLDDEEDFEDRQEE